ncbi:PIN domain-containing protein [Streptomyces sp. SYSU K217416]
MTDSFPVVIADTGALLAYYKGDEPDHHPCRQAMATIGHLVVPPMVLAELDYLVTRHLGAKSAISVLGHIADKVAVGRFEVPEVGPHLHAARAVMQRYVDLEIGLTDAMNAVLAMEFRTDALFTIDRKHFRTIRPLTPHDAFRLLPDDA